MSRFIEGQDRSQSVLFPEQLEDWITEDNPVRTVDAFVEALDLATLGFDRARAADTGRPAYHPATLLKIYIYGYLNRVQSSRRLEREAQRNVELIWLTGRLRAWTRTPRPSCFTNASATVNWLTGPGSLGSSRGCFGSQRPQRCIDVHLVAGRR